MKDLCKGCGRCCYLVRTNKKGKVFPTDILCPHLAKDKGKTKCLIYPRRLWVETGKDCECELREFGPFDYEGCPYNCGKPLVINHKLK